MLQTIIGKLFQKPTRPETPPPSPDLELGLTMPPIEGSPGQQIGFLSNREAANHYQHALVDLEKRELGDFARRIPAGIRDDLFRANFILRDVPGQPFDFRVALEEVVDGGALPILRSINCRDVIMYVVETSLPPGLPLEMTAVYNNPDIKNFAIVVRGAASSIIGTKAVETEIQEIIMKACEDIYKKRAEGTCALRFGEAKSMDTQQVLRELGESVTDYEFQKLSMLPTFL